MITIGPVLQFTEVSGTNRDIYFRKATAIDGSVWATAVALRTATTDDREPCIAVSGEINIHVAWYDNRRGTCYSIYYNYSTDGGITWQLSDIRIDDDNASGDHKVPAMVYDALNNVACIVWHDNRTGDYDIYYYARPLSKALLNDNLSFCENSCNAVRV
ncbi:MAG: hypothetical protein QMD21_01010 [Candidatus Thermoplasmatota archaeon]|nr:hypothetical protein [Candidatus Thermoplasmatota archaeon]